MNYGISIFKLILGHIFLDILQNNLWDIISVNYGIYFNI